MAAPSLHIRVDVAPGVQLGPGKAALLRAIAQEGSIRQAGAALGMSVKKTAALVDDLNSAFAEPLIAATRGGSGGGGAVLTDAGTRILALYEGVRQKAEKAAAKDLAALQSRVRRPGKRAP